MSPFDWILAAVGAVFVLLVVTETSYAVSVRRARARAEAERITNRLDSIGSHVRRVPTSPLEAARIEREAADALALYAGRSLSDDDTVQLVASLNLTTEERARMHQLARVRRARLVGALDVNPPTNGAAAPDSPDAA